MQNTIFSCVYAGSVAYYQTLLNAEHCMIDTGEHFVKSSPRNRCIIASPQGELRLSIPLEKGKNHKRNMFDTTICYEHNWQAIHWKSLCSCYRKSPYFEYYEDKLAPLIMTKEIFLVDFNLKLQNSILTWLKIDKQILISKEYQSTILKTFDFRTQKLPANTLKYRQLFEDKIGFLPDVSVLDLLFNQGKEAKSFLM